MAFTSAAVAIAGAAVSAYGQYEQGQESKKQANRQASIYEEQAAQERDASRQEEQDYRRRASAIIASRRAILGGSGVQVDTGSPLLGTEAAVTEAERQAARIRSGGEIVAGRLEQQAGLTRASGSAAATEGQYQAGASLLSGAGKAYGMWGQG